MLMFPRLYVCNPILQSTDAYPSDYTATQQLTIIRRQIYTRWPNATGNQATNRLPDQSDGTTRARAGPTFEAVLPRVIFFTATAIKTTRPPFYLKLHFLICNSDVLSRRRSPR